MEKRARAIICRTCVVLIVFALTAIVANANSLLNPGFETAGVSNTLAANWTQFGAAVRSGTNNTTLTIHSGGWSMQTVSPGSTNTDATGAYQDVTASAGQNWRLTGYLMTWQNDRLTGPDGFGQAQLVFLDSTNGVIQVVAGPACGTDAPMPVNTWVPFEVDATNAPAGTVKVRTYVLYVGNNLDIGSIFFDDMNLYQPTGGSSTITPAVQPAVQISWPTSAPSNGIDYQVQSITNLVFTNSVAVNVLTNAGFETGAVSNAADNTTIAGWSQGGAGGRSISSSPNPTHSGIGALKMIGAANPPVVYQTFSASPGQVWNFSGYAYKKSTDTYSTGCRGLLKIVWNDASNAAQPPVIDGNFIGGLDTPPYYGIVSGQITPGSPADSWQFLEAQGTAPSNTVTVQFLEILVGATSTLRFDDVVAAQPVSFAGWKNFGPLWLGNGHTNQVFDPIGSNKQKFYRVTTP